MNQISKGDNERGFTLVEIIVVLVIIAILAAIAIPAFTAYIEKSRVAVMVHNQGQVIRTLQLLKIESNLVWDFEAIKLAVLKTGVYVANPINKSIEIRKSTDKASFSGIVISQNSNLTLAQQMTSELSIKNNFYPLSAGTTIDRTIFEGTVMVRIAKDGAFVYYYFDEKINNVRIISLVD